MQALAPPEPVVVKNVDFLGLHKLVLVPFFYSAKWAYCTLYSVQCTRLEGGKNWFFLYKVSVLFLASASVWSCFNEVRVKYVWLDFNHGNCGFRKVLLTPFGKAVTTRGCEELTPTQISRKQSPYLETFEGAQESIPSWRAGTTTLCCVPARKAT